MIAVDAGFLYALVDADDHWHAAAKAQVGSAAEGWVSTWPVATEAADHPSDGQIVDRARKHFKAIDRMTPQLG